MSTNSPILLSTEGSGRPTAYIESSKIISFRGKTHCVWLDTPDEGFRICARTFDQAKGTWSRVVTIGEAADNHGGPALTIDAEGYLHIVYFSHHHPFRYHRSTRPNDVSEWGRMEEFGTDLTYPTLLCARDGTLVLSARRSYEDRPWELELWKKPPSAGWARQAALLRSDHPNYSQYAASIVWGRDHRSLYLGFRIYQQPSYDKPPYSYSAVGCMMSPDEGRTWSKLDGTRLELPATVASSDIIMRTETSEGRVLVSGAIALSPDGVPFIGYGVSMDDSCEGYLATPRPGGGWNHLHLNRFLPVEARDEALVMSGGIVFKPDGQPVIVSPVVNLDDGQTFFGHPETRLVRLDSTDGGRSFVGRLIGGKETGRPQWLPSIERPTGFNDCSGTPGMIYTDGERGAGCNDVLKNRVFWRRLD